jgi:four helix bundle protein
MEYRDHKSYKIGFELANIVWIIVKEWDILAQSTIGKQLVRSADSISSNISEGWSRYYKKDKILFFNYARSSFYETIDWLDKAHQRGLIKDLEYNNIKVIIEDFPREINGLIKGTRINLKK